MDTMSRNVVAFCLLVAGLVAACMIGFYVVRSTLPKEYADAGMSLIVGLIFASFVALWSMIKDDARLANIERMVKKLYEHAGLGVEDRNGKSKPGASDKNKDNDVG